MSLSQLHKFSTDIIATYWKKHNDSFTIFSSSSQVIEAVLEGVWILAVAGWTRRVGRGQPPGPPAAAQGVKVGSRWRDGLDAELPSWCPPAVVLVGHDVDEWVGGEGDHDQHEEGDVAPGGQHRGREQVVRLVVEAAHHRREGADGVATQYTVVVNMSNWDWKNIFAEKYYIKNVL